MSGSLDRASDLANSGQLRSAADECRAVLAIDKSNADAHRLLGQIEHRLGHPKEARRHLARAIDLSPKEQDYHDLARAHTSTSRFDEARRVLQKGMRRFAGSEMLAGSLAEVCASEGKHDEALGVLTPVLDALDDRTPHPAVAVSLSYIAARTDRTELAIDLLARVAEDRTVDSGARIFCRFRLAQLLDQAARYDEAWREAERANSEITTDFDPDLLAQRVDALVRDWSAQRAAGWAAPEPASNKPVFIVGLPRSGTSLVEQILSIHPKVHAAGETPIIPDTVGALAQMMSEAGIAFTDDLADAVSGQIVDAYHRLGKRAERITDKLPDNIMHIGLIAMTMPKARVVHCVRDPLDACLSCYFHHFGGSIPYAYDPAHLGAYAKQTERLMEHWKQAMPIEIHTLRYEDLVEDQERVTRELLGFLGLDWHDTCLRFHESKRVANTASIDQVRRPLFSSSIGRHKHYDEHLGPLRGALG